MLDQAIREKLRDPAYLDLHLTAVMAIGRVGRVEWYDSHFLRRYEAAKLYLSQVRPDALGSFVRGFDVLLPPTDFRNLLVSDLLDASTREQIRAAARAIPKEYVKDYEMRDFGRHIVHDFPLFVEIQRQLLPRISALVGIDLEPGYNFLSLYGCTGRCAPHRDEPKSMFTLDYCIEQSEEWPIWLSKVVDWPTLETMRSWSPEAIKADPALDFRSYALRPGEALLFNGSSQWRYRDPIKPGGFCSLLFFHYYPAGCKALVTPRLWPQWFDIPELVPLCELFNEYGGDGLV